MAVDLFGYESERDKVIAMPLSERIARAVNLLKQNEPPDGYYLAFSGGKDSCAIKALAEMACVKFDAHYNNTTIDPPELVRFIKRVHPEIGWNNSEHGNMMHRVASRTGAPPTRMARWCCEEYKEYSAPGRVCIFGVRSAESKVRAIRWHEVADYKSGSNEKKVICPIVYWTDAQVWEFIKTNGGRNCSCGNPSGRIVITSPIDTVDSCADCGKMLSTKPIPYCELYDEGWDRLGCVRCPLATVERQRKEFDRWPKFEANWKRAIIANWEKWKDVPNSRTGEPRYQAKFRTGEDFWQWWLTTRAPDYMREECQSGQLWTNQELDEL